MSDDGIEPERWHRVEKLFDQTIELDPAERRALLDEQARDAEERREVEALLEAADNPGPLDKPVGELANTLTRDATDSAATTFREGKNVGAWRLLEPLGDGGMGRVFRAERSDGDFGQVGALKIMRWELVSPALVERFKNEQRILAKLEHPGIARLIDGGVTEEGLPYLVMEHVDGQPIDLYCDGERLPLTARLELFLQLCDAVQAAHRRLVVHRDIKPSNILVTPQGRAKLLDFGVGKLLETSAGAELTGTHLAPATPGWAAPEQLTGEEITTATDVYALGVLLYRLLAGSKPVEVESTDPAASARALLESDPEPPSARAEGTAARALRGDLDNITMTALRKEPERRYASVDRLAADVRRYLEGKPVDATPETLGYRMSKFLRRNRAAVAAAGLVLVAIVAGLAATSWQARNARREARKATQVADFLSGLLSSANPYDREARAHSLEDVLHAAAERLEAEHIEDPEVRALILARIGTGYYRLLRRDAEAWDLLSAAERVLEARGEGADLANVRLEKALLASERGDYALQRSLASGAKDYFARNDGPESEGVVRSLLVEALAFRYQGDLEEADRLGREALRRVEALREPPQLLLAQCLAELGSTAELRQDREQSIELLRQALAIFETVGGQSDPDVIALYDEIGITLHAVGRYQEAEASYRRAIELHEARFGANHPGAVDQLTDLARLLLDQGRFSEALELAGRSAQASSGLPESNFERIATEINLATAELETGSVASAADRYQSALDLFVAALGEDHPAVARARSLLADAVRMQGALEQAEILYRLAFHPENRRLDEAWLGLGRVLADSERPGEAGELFEMALARRSETLPERHWRVLEVEAELAKLAIVAAPSANARAALAEVLDSLEEALGPENWRRRRFAH